MPASVFPDHVRSVEARVVRTGWHQVFNHPHDRPRRAVRCAHCESQRLLGEVRSFDGVMVLGLRSADGLFDRFVLVEGSEHPTLSEAADDLGTTGLCPAHLAVDPVAQRSKVAAEVRFGVKRIVRI